MSALIAEKGEVFIDITKNTLVVHDGTTAGGISLAHEIHTHANSTSMTSGFMSTDDKTKLDALSITGGIQTVLSNTVPATARNTANFNTDFTVVDNPGSQRTDFAISAAFRGEINSDIVALVVALG
jgi:hypothetical protein